MQRILIFFCLLSIAVCGFIACQKEFSLELPIKNLATGTLKDSSGNCLFDSAYGTYYDGVALGDTNYVQVELNVKTTGNFAIYTDLENGFQFADSGFFSTTGLTVIKLKPIGRPILQNSTLFTISFDSSACMFSVNVKDSTGTGLGGGTGTSTSVYTLAGAPNACTNATLTGTYNAGTALNSTNSVSIPVNVTTIGTYSLSTTTVNGYKFSGSGSFTNTGAQNIILFGSGTPITAETDMQKPIIGTSACTFSVVVGAAAAPAVFTLAGTPNACTNAVVSGTFAAATALTAANTVVIGVYVTTVGSYSITTPTVNGYKFSASGTFASTGAQTITLVGSGTPLAGETDIFKPLQGSSTCSFSIVVAPAVAFTLVGAPNACTNFSVGGSYTQGIALTSNNTVQVTVNVTAIGNYTLSSTTVNGMTFSATGTFSILGTQAVILFGTGTPVAAGNAVFSVPASGSSCNFTVPVVANSSPCPLVSANLFSLYNSAGTKQFDVSGAAGVVVFNDYELQAPLFNASLTIAFPGTSQPPPGAYSIGSAVSIKVIDPGFIQNAITWNASSGTVYVTAKPNSSGIIVTFCNIIFTGTSLINSNVYQAVGAGEELSN
jgi:hypothetical protein